MTAAQIGAIQPGVTERYVSDEAVKNLYLKVSPGGGRSWFWIAKLRDERRSSRKLMIGRFPAFGMADARERATEWNAMRDRGSDPVAIHRAEAEALAAADEAERERQRDANANTVRAVWDRYIRTKERRRSVAEKKRLVERNLLDEYGDKPISELTQRDVRTAIDKVIDRGASATGNRVLCELRPFLDWALDRELVERNVAAAVRKDPDAEGENPRRALRLVELGYLWRATSATNKDGTPVLDDDERDFLRLLLLTGCRRVESSGARYSELDGDLWKTPRDRTKTKVEYKLPLSGQSLAIFTSRKDQERDLLFCDSHHKAIFKRAIGRFAREVEKIAGRTLAPWDLHSIRHGFRTEAVQTGATNPHTAEKILNHSLLRYDHGDYIDEKRAGIAAWEAVLMAEVAKQLADAAS